MKFSAAVVIGLTLGSMVRGGDAVLELTVGETAFVGRAVAYDDHVCWLAQPDGQLTRLTLDSVTSFRRVGDDFEGMSSLEARNALRKSLGRDWEIVGTGHYLVCASKGRARVFAECFEDVYRSFRSYFSRRGFHLPEPEFPLIAIVFSNPQEFAQQCARDQVPVVPGLRGYYHRKTNRISLFEQGENFVSTGGGTSSDESYASIQANLKDTIVHEATHQVAHNLGLHSRVGPTPRWVVEGLATMFEAEGTRQNTGGKHPRSRVNAERLWWFGGYRADRRESGSLPVFIAREDGLGSGALDFYAEAWALTFFLAETRPREYAGYLKLVAERDPLQDYSPRQRIADFQSVFGQDLARLEVEYLRFIDDLE